MPQDEDRVFDVSKPHKTSPDATSRPIIVGHQPQMTDPMVNEHRPIEPQHNPGEPEHVPAGELLEHPPTEGTKPAHVAIQVQDGEQPPQAPLMEHHLEVKEPTFVPPAESKAPDNPVSGPDSIYPQHDSSSSQTEQPAAPAPQMPGAATPTPADQAVAPTVVTGPPMNDLPLPTHHATHANHSGHAPHQSKPAKNNGKLLWVLAIVILLVGVYTLLDATTSAMPFHIFKKSTPTVTQTTINTTNNAQSAAASTPTASSGLKVYTLSGAGVTFNYPTAWGNPTATAEPGFSKRGGSNASDGTYAYLVNFATNKDVQLVFTSPKFLPVSRGPLYYDYLQVCIGTNDAKFYKSTLHFTTSNGVDTPSTITCDQGPLLDATKIDASTIVQQNTKAPDGSALGDLYTENLTSTSLNVVRAKDASMTNSAAIKTLLSSIKLTAAS